MKIMSNIHPTAIISPGAVIGEGCSVGPYAVIGAKVILGRNNLVHAHVVLEGNTKIGDNNQIFQFASIGAAPQDLKYKGEDSILEIGDQNIIREYVTLQPGTAPGGMITRIGSRNLFMANSHVGHDSIIGDGNIFANSVGLSGHVTVGNYVNVGGLSGIHQFVRLGDLAFVGGGSMIIKDVPPFCIVQGDRAGLVGLNKVGLERKGINAEQQQRLQKLYRQLFLSPGTITEKLEKSQEAVKGFAPGEQLLKFITESKRGVTFPRRKTGIDSDGD